MRIAILGSRGIPANYGGFETFAQHLSTQLVERGHQVTVYCCSIYSPSKSRCYKGVRRVILPTIKIKSIEKLFYATLSLIHVSFTKNEIILMLGVSSAFFCFIPRIFGKKVVTNIDGLEWKRKKWSRIVSFFLKIGERTAGMFSNEVIADSKVIQKYYLNKYGKSPIFIAYGAEIKKYPAGEILEKSYLKKDDYILYVSRLEPENNAHLLVSAFEKLKTDMNLVIVGDASYNNHYINQLKKANDPRIKFLGAVYGDGYKELQSNSYVYVHGNEVGGTNPALLEAMGRGNCVLVINVPYNREVLAQAGILYKKSIYDLREKLQFVIDNPKLVSKYRRKAQQRIASQYTWEKIVNEYEKLFLSIS